ncbi:hypothetical protein I302_106922 [Kwoniella bestiolae CBS 10118]|uniref:Uncharacterized protein n=1 Tax=Kwoniella bestiolae CBS 10118 TaxID=1296100 RepID=A0A1B9G012_9TREE|nr:hypothetical protein I302_05812 [Kwoniella bestiolae CBS 10118]OCF24352.1 hypothetical protein I302_05812 [Kwoniella bestiolae CBS 10118]
MTAMAPSMSPTSSSTGGLPMASTSMTSTAQHRLSVSGRPRRPSPLLHEIQPPSRRLSAHQMLLLTPFGGPLPAGALAGAGGMGMSRGSSSMGHALPTAPARLGSGTSQSSGWPRRDSGPSSGASSPVPLGRELPVAGRPSTTSAASSMGREPPAANRFPPRSRHSLAHPVVNPSPLASAPMTTIFSQGSSEGNSSKSRDASNHEMERNQTFMSRDEVGAGVEPRERPEEAEEDIESPPKSRARLLSATVAMTRSNSLPVLTLRELQALKEKDGELGIQRGGDWAWVSRDGDGDGDGDELDEAELETPSLGTETSTNASTSTTSLVTPLEQPASSSSYRNPFTSFNDPFAPRQPGVTPVSVYAPMATSSDYHYSPTGPGAELRRMSDAPPTTSTATPSPTSRGGRRSVTDSRRPSAPNVLRQSFSALTPRPVQRRTPPQASQAIFQQPPSYQAFTAPEETSPHGSPIASLPPASRPRLLRYKSSPARTTGLGLNIVVRPTNPGSDRSSGDPGSAGTESRGSMGEQSNGNTSAGPSRSSFTTGHWAEVDFIDSLAAAADIALAASESLPPSTSISGAASAIGMSRTSSSISPTATAHRHLAPSPARASLSSSSSSRKVSSQSQSAPQTAMGSKYKIEHVTSRSHIHEFEFGNEPTFKGRSRFESVDSAFPLMPGGTGGRLSVPTSGAGETYAHSNRIGSFSAVENGLQGLSEGFPRRGSLGMGTFAKLRKMISSTGSGSGRGSGGSGSEMVDELGQRLVVASGGEGARAASSPHWSERRGSWAEGWSNAT